MKRFTFAAVAALLVLVPWQKGVRAEPPLYTIENLGTFGGLVPTIAGVNASGQVVGNVANAFGSQAVRYTNGSGWQALPGLTAGFSVATGINVYGDVVGYFFTTDGLGNVVQRAFRYRDGFPLDTIEPLPGGLQTQGFAINASGEVVGISDNVPFRATPPMAAQPMPSLGGGFAFVCGLNDAGQAAGVGLTPAPDFAQHAMRVDPGAATAVDVFGLEGAASTSIACAIDADGTVGGQSSRGLNVNHAFRYRDVGGAIDLDTFGSALSNVESIAGGVSVGWYTLPDINNSTRAFAHRDADGSFDLNFRIDAPGWLLTLAKGVNASGVIVGEGTFNGQPAVFRLTPKASTDTTPPVINSISANPSTIFPPNGQMVAVSALVSATDDSGTTPVCTLTSITGGGAGDSTVTPGTLDGSVRAVGGRTYTLNVSCADAAGNSSAGAAAVFVTPDTTAPSIASVTPSLSNLWPPDNRLVDVTVSVLASDDVDLTPACGLSGITGAPAGSGDAIILAPFSARLRAVGGRTYTLTVECHDAAGNSNTKSTDVVVPPDTTAPVIASVTPSQSSIWPPNGKMVIVTVEVNASDDVDAYPQCSLVKVTGGGADDSMITGRFSASLRAQKGNVYCLQVVCRDRAGNTSSKDTKVSVLK